ncbi:MAG: YicC/YloC family endoribonuclease [Syntrophotaleaceae bacterium]
MIKSMTGFGKGQASAGNVNLTVEVKSVNHRYGDITIKLPRSLMAAEGEIRKRVGERLKRGRIDVYVNLDQGASGGKVPVLDGTLAENYLRLFSRMQEEYGLQGGITLALLASQKDVISLQELDPDTEEVWASLDTALDLAVDAVEKMRRTEGEATGRDIVARLELLEDLLNGIEQRAPLIPREWQGKLKERLQKLENGFEIDPQRIAQEIALFADRCDISEEISRFKSHMEQFRALLTALEPVGRQLDFLVQELNREANTMGSKSNDVELTRHVVAVKAELEKIREQVQNVE